MKIGVITISHGTNYGNRLQIYAVQRVLEKLGHEPYLINNFTDPHGPLYGIKKIIKLIIGYKDNREEFARSRSFGRCDRKHIRFAPVDFGKRYYTHSLAADFDVLLCGSDQIWNPYAPFNNADCFGNLPGARKRISYAASFGVADVPEDKKEKIGQWLRGMDAVSVREDSGVNIVKELADMDAQVHIDPTMMLSAEEWSQIEEPPVNLPESDYVFRYFLGSVTPEVSGFIDDFAKRNGLAIYDVLPEKNHPNYCLNPANFIWLLHHSRCVMTDSFHAAVFSFLFRRNVRVFDRVDRRLDMSTRLDTLLKLFDAAECRNNFSPNPEACRIPDPDIILKAERLRSIEYLTGVLSE